MNLWQESIFKFMWGILRTRGFKLKQLLSLELYKTQPLYQNAPFFF